MRSVCVCRISKRPDRSHARLRRYYGTTVTCDPSRLCAKMQKAKPKNVPLCAVRARCEKTFFYFHISQLGFPAMVYTHFRTSIRTFHAVCELTREPRGNSHFIILSATGLGTLDLGIPTFYSFGVACRDHFGTAGTHDFPRFPRKSARETSKSLSHEHQILYKMGI